ncbi:MAG TPA: succinate dehydrogenase, hydrophobic membrane anchor protein [Burkholderiales bacterium]|nr:succinate dehydrogenase, hydrophobic membrane anchor protein [Burkholderiales bacterium]
MNRYRPLGSAHRGLMEFLVQRVTSIYLAGFTIYVLIYLGLQPVKNYAAWSTYFAHDLVRLAWGLFFISLLLHSWTGLRSISLDYVKPTWLRFTVQLLTILVLIALGLWTIDILMRGAA